MGMIHAHAIHELSLKQTTENFKIAFYVTDFKAGEFIVNICIGPYYTLVLNSYKLG